jgi:hypothetical protein
MNHRPLDQFEHDEAQAYEDHLAQRNYERERFGEFVEPQPTIDRLTAALEATDKQLDAEQAAWDAAWCAARAAGHDTREAWRQAAAALRRHQDVFDLDGEVTLDGEAPF